SDLDGRGEVLRLVVDRVRRAALSRRLEPGADELLEQLRSPDQADREQQQQEADAAAAAPDPERNAQARTAPPEVAHVAAASQVFPAHTTLPFRRAIVLNIAHRRRPRRSERRSRRRRGRTDFRAEPPLAGNAPTEDRR